MHLLLGERILKSEISNLQAEKSLLESRVSNLISTRAGEKATLSLIEKKLAEEKKQKIEFQVFKHIPVPKKVQQFSNQIFRQNSRLSGR